MATKKKKVDPNKELKAKFIDYYSALPIQKLGADYIGVHENTIIDWKNKDPEFRDQVLNAASRWAKSKAGAVKSNEWLLERVMKNHFAERKELTGADGERLVPKPIMEVDVLQNQGDQKDSQPDKTD